MRFAIGIFRAPNNLGDLIARVNRLRRENPALQSNYRLSFHPVNNDQIIAYTKSCEDGTNTILTVVNLDPQHTQSGWLVLPPRELRLDLSQTYQMHDLLREHAFLWKGPRNYVELIRSTRRPTFFDCASESAPKGISITLCNPAKGEGNGTNDERN